MFLVNKLNWQRNISSIVLRSLSTSIQYDSFVNYILLYARSHIILCFTTSVLLSSILQLYPVVKIPSKYKVLASWKEQTWLWVFSTLWNEDALLASAEFLILRIKLVFAFTECTSLLLLLASLPKTLGKAQQFFLQSQNMLSKLFHYCMEAPRLRFQHYSSTLLCLTEVVLYFWIVFEIMIELYLFNSTMLAWTCLHERACMNSRNLVNMYYIYPGLRQIWHLIFVFCYNCATGNWCCQQVRF